MNTKLSVVTLVCVLGISMGQLLFKKAAMNLPQNPSVQDWILNGWLITALVLYGVTTLGWVWVLKNAPLYLAYPFMGLAFIIVPVLAKFFLNEPLSIRTIVGGFLILVGVIVVSGGSHA